LILLGANSGYVGKSYGYSTSATDPDGDQVKYTFSWEDGSTSETEYVNSGLNVSASHTWRTPGTYGVKARATDIYGASSQWSGSRDITISTNPPNTSSKPSGLSNGYTGTAYSYSTVACDPDGDPVKYTFDWGDNSTSETVFVNSGINANASHSWSIPGIYKIKTIVTDIYGATSSWSSSKNITISNQPPNTYNYSTSTTDPDGDQVNYIIDWGDGATSETGFLNSGTNASISHSWRSPGTYNIRAKATDIYGATSQWSGYKNVTIFSNPPNTPSVPLGPSTGYTSQKILI
jgi:plastocyanin